MDDLFDIQPEEVVNIEKAEEQDDLFSMDGEIISTEINEDRKISLDDMIPDDNTPPAPSPKSKMDLNLLRSMSFDKIDEIIDPESVLQQPLMDHERLMWERINEFENTAFDPTVRGLKLKDPKLDKALNGLQAGLHIVAGCSNHGKSAMLTDIEVGLLQCNDDVYVMSFSLDDAYDDKFSRVAAILNNTTINFIKHPMRFDLKPDPNDPWYIKWKNCITKVRSIVPRYMIYDNAAGTYIEDIEQKIIDTLATLDNISMITGKKKKLVVCIDSFHDLDTRSINSKSNDAKFEVIAKWARATTIKYNIPMIASAELKKMNAHRRPILDDIRDAIKIQYAAKSIMLVYNEVSQKSESAQIFYTVQNEAGKQPVLELYFAKNKCSEFKGRLYYLFKPEMVKLVPATDENEKKWNSKIYG